MDEPISAGTAGGEAATFDRELLVEHYGWVHSVARNLVRDRWGAEDVTQETVLAALSAPPRDANDAPRLRAWLSRVAFNLSRLGSRQGARRRAREERVARSESLPSVSDEVEAGADQSELMRAVASLDEPYRLMVEMRYFDGLSTAEIARRSGATELAVRKRLWRARGKLRDALGWEEERGRMLALVLPLRWLGNAMRRKGVAALAAGLAVTTAGVTWWIEGGSRAGFVALAPSAAVSASAALAPAPLVAVAEEHGARPGAGAPPDLRDSRRDALPVADEPRRPEREDTPPLLPELSGLVLDLDGAPRAGLAVSDLESPAALLARSDATGSFHLRPRALPLTLVAGGPGWTSIAPARAETCDDAWPALIVVAESAELAGEVLDPSGAPVAGAALALRCDERAFAAIDRPVELATPVLRSAVADARGAFTWTDAPRGPGLSLVITAPGYVALERDTLALAGFERFVLERAPLEPELAGTVRRLDGSPAAGASVRLALASTTADENGRFHLPLRGVLDDSELEAWERGSAPARFKGFGREVRAGRGDGVDLVLGEQHHDVDGEIADETGNGRGWRVCAFAEDELAPGVELEPVAETVSDGTGAFHFQLPNGRYTVVALDPRGLRLARAGEQTVGSRWHVDAPAGVVPPPRGGRVHDSDGRALPGAHLALSPRLAQGEAWLCLPERELVAGADGAWSIALDARLELEVVVAHPAAETRTFVLGRAGEGAELELPRAAFARVLDPLADELSVLDGAGRALTLRGPTRSGECFRLEEGASPTLAVPGEARWLLLRRGGDELARLPLAPEAGRVLTLVR